MYIDKKSPIPVYYQLKNIILAKIKSGEYKEDSLIPSERELGDTLNISRMTVRQALNQLVAEGLLRREKGKGTFVSKPKLEQRNIMSFSDTVRSRGMNPVTRVLHFKKLPAGEEIAKMLSIDESDPVYDIKRLRLADDNPIAIEEACIPEKYCPDLNRFDLTGSLYKILKEEYRHTIDYVDNVIEASKPSREEKSLLQINTAIPVLSVGSIVSTSSGIKLLYEKSVYRSDEFKYNTRVYGNNNV